MKLPKLDELNIVGDFREMTEKDVKQVHSLLQNYLKKFDVTLRFSEQEIKHMFLSAKGVVHAFVVENKEKKQITDFVSFYSLPSTIL